MLCVPYIIAVWWFVGLWGSDDMYLSVPLCHGMGVSSTMVMGIETCLCLITSESVFQHFASVCTWLKYCLHRWGGLLLQIYTNLWEKHVAAWSIGAVFVCLTLPLSLQVSSACTLALFDSASSSVKCEVFHRQHPSVCTADQLGPKTKLDRRNEFGIFPNRNIVVTLQITCSMI